MKQQKKDILSRRPVVAQIVVSSDVYELYISECLPEGYSLHGRIFQFPAGYHESYLINGKDYNFQGNRSLEEQRKLIEEDLASDSFTKDEIKEFIKEIEIEESKMPIYLSLEASREWLKSRPEFKQKALQLLDEIRNEAQNKAKQEIRSGMKRK